MNLRVNCVPLRDVDKPQFRDWERLQQTGGAVDNAFLRPEFSQAVASVRDDVEVAFLTDEYGETVAVFPFQRGPRGAGKPVGGRMSNFHGIVAGDGLLWDSADLIRGCGLRSWAFDQVPADQAPFAPYFRATSTAPYIDFSDGFETYQDEMQEDGRNWIKNAAYQSRRIGRKVAPVRFETDVKDPEALEVLICWKSQQYRQTGQADLFAHDWATTLVRNMLGHCENDFSVRLSVLYVGERPLAITYGLCAAGIYHGWFMAFDREFAEYSPGFMLMFHMLQHFGDLGIRRIDLAKGSDQYKQRLANGTVLLGKGAVDFSVVRKAFRVAWHATSDYVRSSPLAGPARIPRRLIRRLATTLSIANCASATLCPHIPRDGQYPIRYPR